MAKYVCPCGYVYDESKGDKKRGISAGTSWQELPEDWSCPVCALDKELFDKKEEKI